MVHGDPMFERFTNKARHVVVLAQEEARRLQHNYIGTEHVLLGLLGESDGLAFRVLQGYGISLEGTREEVKAVVGTGRATISGHIPFTPRAKKTLELALREALQLHHNYIGTEHILLGVIREQATASARRSSSSTPATSRRSAWPCSNCWSTASTDVTRGRRWLRRRVRHPWPGPARSPSRTSRRSCAPRRLPTPA